MDILPDEILLHVLYDAVRTSTVFAQVTRVCSRWYNLGPCIFKRNLWNYCDRAIIPERLLPAWLPPLLARWQYMRQEPLNRIYNMPEPTPDMICGLPDAMLLDEIRRGTFLPMTLVTSGRVLTREMQQAMCTKYDWVMESCGPVPANNAQLENVFQHSRRWSEWNVTQEVVLRRYVISSMPKLLLLPCFSAQDAMTFAERRLLIGDMTVLLTICARRDLPREFFRRYRTYLKGPTCAISIGSPAGIKYCVGKYQNTYIGIVDTIDHFYWLLPKHHDHTYARNLSDDVITHLLRALLHDSPQVSHIIRYQRLSPMHCGMILEFHPTHSAELCALHILPQGSNIKLEIICIEYNKALAEMRDRPSGKVFARINILRQNYRNCARRD